MLSITRRVEFDAGHRIPNHKSKCRNFHGHRYVLELTVVGPLIEQEGASDEGMVKDFGDLKTLMNETIADIWDHGFLVYWDDKQALLALENLQPNHRTIILDFIPTVENLAAECFRLLQAVLQLKYGAAVHAQRVVLYETPNCWAEVTR